MFILAKGILKYVTDEKLHMINSERIHTNNTIHIGQDIFMYL